MPYLKSDYFILINATAWWNYQRWWKQNSLHIAINFTQKTRGWNLLSDLVQIEFTLTAGFFMVLFNRFTPLPHSQPEGNGWGAQHQQKLHLHPQDNTYKGKADLLEHNNSRDVFRKHFHVTNIETVKSAFLSSTVYNSCKKEKNF